MTPNSMLLQRNALIITSQARAPPSGGASSSASRFLLRFPLATVVDCLKLPPIATPFVWLSELWMRFVSAIVPVCRVTLATMKRSLNSTFTWMILALGRAHNATSPDFSKEISLAFNTLFDRCHHHQIIKFNKLRFKFNFKFNQRTRVISAKSFDQLTHFAKGILSLWLFLILAVLSTPEIFDGFFCLFSRYCVCVCLLFMRRVDHTSPFRVQLITCFQRNNWSPFELRIVAADWNLQCTIVPTPPQTHQNIIQLRQRYRIAKTVIFASGSAGVTVVMPSFRVPSIDRYVHSIHVSILK